MTSCPQIVGRHFSVVIIKSLITHQMDPINGILLITDLGVS